MTPTILHHPIKQLLWISDIHLDQACEFQRQRFFNKLKCLEYDSLLITGDISTSKWLGQHLGEIAKTCGTRPVFYTSGNHEHYGSSFSEVDRAIADLCSRHQNLIALGNGEIIELSKHTALIGHRGWFDGTSGAGDRTWVDSPDRHLIHDFQNLDRAQFFQKLRLLGRESARYFRRLLPLALSRYRTVLIATHIPPFTQALRHGDTFCRWERQPFFSNNAAGNAIMGISRSFSPQRKHQIVVYAGHSHCPVTMDLNRSLRIRVAGAQPGFPATQGVVTIN